MPTRLSASGRGSSPASSLGSGSGRSEEHTSELQSLAHLVCRLLLEKKKPRNVAKSSTDPWHAGDPTGVLDRVAVSIKPNIAPKGQPILLGSALLPLVAAGRDPAPEP